MNNSPSFWQPNYFVVVVQVDMKRRHLEEANPLEDILGIVVTNF